MTIANIDASQRTAAKVAGFSYLFTFAIVVFANFGIYDKLVVADSVAETATNILANETLFRIGIACDLVYGLAFVAMLTALYVILKPVDRSLALLSTFWQLVYAVAWVLLTLKFFDALRLLSADYLRVFEAERSQALARMFLSARFDRYYGGLLFYALGATVTSYLWFKSRYVPRALAAVGVAACAWCTVCAFAFLVFPKFSDTVDLLWFDAPMALFEIVLSFWLLFVGLKPSGDAAHD